MGFNFDRMTSCFEKIQEDYTSTRSAIPRPLPNTERFLTAMDEVTKLFETLGTAFTFVKRDIDKKLSVISRHAIADPPHFADLNTAVAHEIVQRTLSTRAEDGLPSCARTLLRLMWALKFADVLLDGLRQAFDPKSGLSSYNRTLRWAATRAYDATFAERHTWTMRRSVMGACVLLPTKEAFMDRLGVDAEKRKEFMKRLSLSMSPLVERMYAFYDKNDLLNLP